MKRDSAAWRIWIDTGGTFTDGLGIDPEGRLHRVKILSTGALRGIIVGRAAPGGAGARRIRVKQAWDLPADFVRGFRFRLLGRPTPDLTVERFDPAYSLLDLSGDLPEDPAPGAAFEVAGLEESPVLAARILTRTAPGSPLPDAA